MSLLGKQVYANPDTPLWLGTAGGTIDGNLTVTGNVIADGNIQAKGNMSSEVFITIDPSGTPTGGLFFQSTTTGATSNGMLIQGDLLKFAKLGTSNANTSLTIGTAGANTDNFTLGGTLVASIGPVPTQIITSTKTVNPVAISPAAPSQFGVDTTITGISGAEYDVQVTGTVFLVSGTMDPADTVVFTFTSGAGQGSISAVVFPDTASLGANGVSGIGPLTAGGGAANVTLRARVSPNASGTTLGASVRAFDGGSSSAVYGATLTILDVQRVR